MNGTPPPDTPSRRGIVEKSSPRGASLPILVAIVASALVHAGFMFVPYLGRGINSPAAGSRQPASRYAITVRLAPPATTQADLQKTAADAISAQSPDPQTRGQTEQPTNNTIGTNLLPIPGMAFYPTEQLNKRPQPVEAVDFDSPDLGGISQAGKIVLRLWIDESGAVADVKLDKTDLPETITGPVMAIFKRSMFLPGERSGKRVGSIMKIEVDIDPRPPLR